MPTQYRGVGRFGQTIATSFTTAAGSALIGFSANTNMARIIVTQSAYLSMDSTSGSSSGAYIAANVPEYITVNSTGTKIGVISSVTATTGFIFATEIS